MLWVSDPLIVDEAIAAIPSGEPVDLIHDFAEGVAIAVMCEFVGVSNADRALWARGADAELSLIGAVLDEDAQLGYATDFVRMQQRIAQLLEDAGNLPATTSCQPWPARSRRPVSNRWRWARWFGS